MSSLTAARTSARLLITVTMALGFPITGSAAEQAQDDGQRQTEERRNSPEWRQDEGGVLQEIVVTAQKRNERLQDVPMSITALTAEDLVQSQSRRLEDYVGKVPGLTLIGFNGLGSQLVIRGLSSGSVAVNSGVATYIDETPFAIQGPFAGSYLAAPNLDTFDIQRIEVLRGPQGTLYGANALSGLMKYVTNPPDPTELSGAAEMGLSSVKGGGTGYELRGMVNIPFSDKAALRVMGYDNHYPGFIDDPSRGLRNTNDSQFRGGRATFLYQATPDLSFHFSALHQERQWDDYANVDIDPATLSEVNGDLVRQKHINNHGLATTQIFNGTVNWDFGLAKLVSATSYFALKPHANYEFPTLNAVMGLILGPQFAAAAVDLNQPVKAVTQEVRLSSSGSGPFEWQVGGYFINEGADERQTLLPIDTTKHEIAFGFPTVIGDFHIPVHYKEYAGFLNLDYHFTPTLDVGIGGRYSSNRQTFHETQLGLFGGPELDSKSSESVTTYSSDLRWHVTPDNMLYARIASGFAPGGPNLIFAGSTLPTAFKSSTTRNYEVGLKSNLLEKRLTIEASVFNIDWNDIQLLAVINGFGVVANGGTARSRGMEWNVNYAPVRGLTLNFNGSYTDAHLTEATPASVGGVNGDPLPGVPKWQGSASATYSWPLFGNYDGFAGANWRYSGHRLSDFVAGSPRIDMPSYNIFDVRAGVETERWTFALYARNVGDERAIIFVQPETLAGGNGLQEANIYTPRTIGATLSLKFK